MQLLDLLSAAGSEELEPTQASGKGRGPLYPEVRFNYFSWSTILIRFSVPIHSDPHGRC